MNKYINIFKDKTNAARVIDSWNVDTKLEELIKSFNQITESFKKS